MLLYRGSVVRLCLACIALVAMWLFGAVLQWWMCGGGWRVVARLAGMMLVVGWWGMSLFRDRWLWVY